MDSSCHRVKPCLKKQQKAIVSSSLFRCSSINFTRKYSCENTAIGMYPLSLTVPWASLLQATAQLLFCLFQIRVHSVMLWDLTSYSWHNLSWNALRSHLISLSSYRRVLVHYIDAPTEWTDSSLDQLRTTKLKVFKHRFFFFMWLKSSHHLSNYLRVGLFDCKVKCTCNFPRICNTLKQVECRIPSSILSSSKPL